VTGRILALVAANVLMLAVGVGLLPALRLAGSRRELVTKAPLGYAVGLATTGIVAATLALVGVGVGPIALPLMAVASLAYGLRAVRGPSSPARRWQLRDVAPLAVLAVVGVYLAAMSRAFAVIPIVASDGWAIWGTRARALYELGTANAAPFTSSAYPALQHPLWLPAIEAVDARFMGRYDVALVDLQLLGLAIAFAGGAWVLLRDHAPPLLLAASLLAIVTTPMYYNQLQSNFADVPVAMFVALGVASLAAWLRSPEPGLLAAGALFLGAGALTKNEGELFALTAYVAAGAVCVRSRWRALGLAALGTLAIDLPWRIWIQVNHIQIEEYSISNAFDPGYLSDHANRVGPSARELVVQLGRPASFSYVCILALVGIAGALVLRRLRLALFAASWLVLSFAGLLMIYWISTNPLSGNLFNSSYRTIVSLVLGGALLAPVLLGVEGEPEPREP
jgi:hypothetical protein